MSARPLGGEQLVKRSDVPDGYRIRTANASDRSSIVRLCLAVHGDLDGAGSAVLFDQGDPSDWTVVEDAAGNIVSTCVLLGHRLRVGTVIFPAGQIEYVSTAAPFRRRGLIRAQIALLHGRSEARGDLASFVSGIPYFYRRFGYGYAMDYPPLHSLSRVMRDSEMSHHPATTEWVVREMAAPDLEAVRDLHEAAMAGADVVEIRDDRAWDDQLYGRTVYDQTFLVAERAGRVDGHARLTTTADSERILAQATAVDPGCFAAILAYAAAVSASHEVLVAGSPCPVVGPILSRLEDDHRYLPLYGRIPDPLRMLEQLRPEFDRRLGHADSVPSVESLDISLYASSIRFDFDGRRVDGIEEGPADEDPTPEKVAVSPDHLPALVFGRFDPPELARRVDDVQLGQHSELMRTLFPRLRNAIFADL